MKLGCSTLLFAGHDFDTAIAALGEAGYDAVELGAIPGMGEHLKPGEAPEVYQAMRAKLDAAGLALESVGCSGALGTDRFEPLAEAARAMGAPYMTLGTGGTSDNEASWETVVAQLREALPVCERTGIKLSVKPHVRSAVYNVATARRMLDELQSEWIGLNMDNTHLQRVGEDPIQAVHELRDRICTARIRDYLSDDLSIGPLENQIPGKGMADVPGYYQALTEVPGLQYVVLEMVGTRDLPLPEVQRVVGEALVALRSYQ
ncbi:sugar phosphate isomerase/epimerase [bacterium]|nr:sugar phosphate isomerase/epimerase [bacterium]